MAGHSRSKNGVAPLAYVRAIHVYVSTERKEDVYHRGKPGDNDPRVAAIRVSP